MSLSERIRPDIECAPWVIKEIIILEQHNKDLIEQLVLARQQLKRYQEREKVQGWTEL